LRKNYSLSIFFPCYNEEGNVEELSRKALAVARELTDDYEVIVVDDGSRDRTAAIAGALAEEDPHLRLVRHETNRGYGAALTTGFRAAAKDLVFYTDGDGQFDLGELPKLLPLIENADMVCGYRLRRRDPLPRKVNAWLWGALVNHLFHLRVRDVDCAFKLFRRKIFDRMILTSRGALIDTEILARAALSGYIFVQTGVNHYPRVSGSQTGAKPGVILRAFKELFALKTELEQERKRVVLSYK
jgi:glycosyltransferase involved in cell wall biosynthesis